MNAPAAEGESEAEPASAALQKLFREYLSTELAEVQHPREDIQAVLAVLGTRRREYDPPNQKLDLSKTNLRGASLREANLGGANLYKADLRGAILDGANLHGAHLYRAHLERTLLFQAHLEGANLSGAHLELADLSHADLEGANLDGARLIGANLSHADLRGADLRWADLRGAGLRGADLSSAKNLTREQINSASGDADTKLPPDPTLCLPRSWEGVTANTPHVCPAP